MNNAKISLIATNTLAVTLFGLLSIGGFNCKRFKRFSFGSEHLYSLENCPRCTTDSTVGIVEVYV